MQIKRFLLSVCLFSFISGKAQDSLSFSGAQDTMFNSNILIKAVAEKQSAYSFEQKAAKGLSYPTLQASGSALFLQHDIKLNLNSYKDNVAQILQLANPATLGDWNFVLQKMTYNFLHLVYCGLYIPVGKLPQRKMPQKLISK